SGLGIQMRAAGHRRAGNGREEPRRLSSATAGAAVRWLAVLAPVGCACMVPAMARAQPPSRTSDSDTRAKAIADVVAANLILADQGVVDGYGHVSIRDPIDPTRFSMARQVAP